MVTLGIDRISEYTSLLKGKKLGLITNYSGVDSRLEEDLDVLQKRDIVSIGCLRRSTVSMEPWTALP